MDFLACFFAVCIFLSLFSLSIVVQYFLDKEKQEKRNSKKYFMLFLIDILPGFIIGFMVLDILVKLGFERYSSAALIISVAFAWSPYEVYKHFIRKYFFADKNQDSISTLKLPDFEK